MEIPIRFLNLSISNFIILFLYEFFPVITNLLNSPPQIFKINSEATCKPSMTELGSIPLSNLYFASVLIAKSRAVFLIEEGKK